MWAIMCVCHHVCHTQGWSCLSTGWALNHCFAWFFGTVAVLAQGGGRGMFGRWTLDVRLVSQNKKCRGTAIILDRTMVWVPDCGVLGLSPNGEWANGYPARRREKRFPNTHLSLSEILPRCGQGRALPPLRLRHLGSAPSWQPVNPLRIAKKLQSKKKLPASSPKQHQRDIFEEWTSIQL